MFEAILCLLVILLSYCLGDILLPFKSFLVKLLIGITLLILSVVSFTISAVIIYYIVYFLNLLLK